MWNLQFLCFNNLHCSIFIAGIDDSLNIAILLAQFLTFQQVFDAALYITEHPSHQFFTVQPNIRQRTIFNAIWFIANGTTLAIHFTTAYICVVEQRSQSQIEVHLLTNHITLVLMITISRINPVSEANMNMTRSGTHRTIAIGTRINITSPCIKIGIATQLKSFLRLSLQIFKREISNRSGYNFIARHHSFKLIIYRLNINAEFFFRSCWINVKFQSHTVHLNCSTSNFLWILLITFNHTKGRNKFTILLNKAFRISTNEDIHFKFS